MYLVNIYTLDLEEFIGTTPPYAILSHRWGLEEISFRDMRKKRVDKNLRGYQKLVDACRVAATYQVDYLWMDTCCIDRKSSAELSEAINSMFAWYAKSKVCLAYFEDFNSETDADDSFTKSVWFSRSWTLQELIAPVYEVFYDTNWHYFGDKASQGEVITARTGIPFMALNGLNSFREYSIAERMSWASDREATRPEDIAYSLMGIFDVNMPLLYGEGDKAFLRLQEEIIKQATEHTFLVWGPEEKMTLGLLANSPIDFRSVRLKGVDGYSHEDSSCNLTSTALEIDACLVRCSLGIYGILMHPDSTMEYIVLIQRLSNSDRYLRLGITRSITNPLVWRMKRIKLARRVSMTDTPSTQTLFDHTYLKREHRLVIRHFLQAVILRREHFPPYLEKDHNWSEGRWLNQHDRTILTYVFDHSRIENFAAIVCHLSNSRCLWIEFSFDFDSRPCIRISNSPELIHRYKGIDSLFMFQLSDAIPEETDVIEIRENGRLVKMYELTDSISGSISYFLRSSQTTCFDTVQIPSQLTTAENIIWLTVVPPGCSSPNSSIVQPYISGDWKLLLSPQSPLNHRRYLS